MGTKDTKEKRSTDPLSSGSDTSSSDDDSSSAGDSDAELEPTVSWCQCDRCGKWRRIPAELASQLADDSLWYCENNPNKAFASCDVPQERELTSDEEDENDGDEDESLEAERARRRRIPVVWHLLSDNILNHRKRKVQDEDDVMICQCKPVWRGGDGCGPDCINRMLCIECVPGFCPCEDKCTNQVFSNKQYVKLGVRRAGPKGFGLYAAQDIKAGQFLIEYIGEVLEEEEYLRRKEFYQEVGQRHYYFMNIGNGEVIDACRKGNPARFINHSCDPNCETQKWLVRGELAIGLFSLKDIAKDEELTFDYNFERYGDKPMRCYCKSRGCRRFIGGIQDNYDDSMLVDPEDASNDYQPVMVTDKDMDWSVRSLLDWRVGVSYDKEKEPVMMTRLEKLFRRNGVDWSAAEYLGMPELATSAAVEDAAGPGAPEQQQQQQQPAAATAAKGKQAAGKQAAARKRAPKQQQQQQEESSEEDEEQPTTAAKAHQAARRASSKAASTSGKEAKGAAAAAAAPFAAASAAGEDAKGDAGSGAAAAAEGAGAGAAAAEDVPAFRGPLKAAFKQMKGREQQDGSAAGAAAADKDKKQPAPATPAQSTAAAASTATTVISSSSARTAALAAAAKPAPLRKRVRATPVCIMPPAADAGAAAAGSTATPAARAGAASSSGASAATTVAAQGAAGNGGAASASQAPVPRRTSITTSTPSQQQAQQLHRLQRAVLKRRSEIDRRLDSLVGTSGRLKDASRQNIIKLLRMFNLCDIGAPRNRAQSQDGGEAGGLKQEGQQDLHPHAGPSGNGLAPLPASTSSGVVSARQRARMADLSLLLDVILKTSSATVKKDFVACGVLNQLHQAIGRNFSREFSVILRKLLRVVECLPLTADDVHSVRSAHGTFANVLQELSSNQDFDVRTKAAGLLRKYPLSACSDPGVIQQQHFAPRTRPPGSHTGFSPMPMAMTGMMGAPGGPPGSVMGTPLPGGGVPPPPGPGGYGLPPLPMTSDNKPRIMRPNMARMPGAMLTPMQPLTPGEATPMQGGVTPMQHHPHADPMAAAGATPGPGVSHIRPMPMRGLPAELAAQQQQQQGPGGAAAAAAASAAGRSVSPALSAGVAGAAATAPGGLAGPSPLGQPSRMAGSSLLASADAAAHLSTSTAAAAAGGQEGGAAGGAEAASMEQDMVLDEPASAVTVAASTAGKRRRRGFHDGPLDAPGAAPAAAPAASQQQPALPGDERAPSPAVLLPADSPPLMQVEDLFASLQPCFRATGTARALVPSLALPPLKGNPAAHAAAAAAAKSNGSTISALKALQQQHMQQRHGERTPIELLFALGVYGGRALVATTGGTAGRGEGHATGGSGWRSGSQHKRLRAESTSSSANVRAPVGKQRTGSVSAAAGAGSAAGGAGAGSDSETEDGERPLSPIRFSECYSPVRDDTVVMEVVAIKAMRRAGSGTLASAGSGTPPPMAAAATPSALPVPVVDLRGAAAGAGAAADAAAGAQAAASQQQPAVPVVPVVSLTSGASSTPAAGAVYPPRPHGFSHHPHQLPHHLQQQHHTPHHPRPHHPGAYPHTHAAGALVYTPHATPTHAAHHTPMTPQMPPGSVGGMPRIASLSQWDGMQRAHQHSHPHHPGRGPHAMASPAGINMPPVVGLQPPPVTAVTTAVTATLDDDVTMEDAWAEGTTTEGAAAPGGAAEASKEGGQQDGGEWDWGRPVSGEHADTWDEPDAAFEAFVAEMVRHRLGKYVQPDHPNRVGEEDARALYRKISREVVEKERQAYGERRMQAVLKVIERRKLEHNIKEFVRHSIRRFITQQGPGGAGVPPPPPPPG